MPFVVKLNGNEVQYLQLQCRHQSAECRILSAPEPDRCAGKTTGADQLIDPLFHRHLYPEKWGSALRIHIDHTTENRFQKTESTAGSGQPLDHERQTRNALLFPA